MSDLLANLRAMRGRVFLEAAAFAVAKNRILMLVTLGLALTACKKPEPGGPCRNGSSLGNGYETCDEQVLHREGPAHCSSTLPRPGVISTKPSGCHVDGDCMDLPYGHCEFAEGASFPARCEYGCSVDADCGQGQACFCGDVIGTCIVASCQSDGDCADPEQCVVLSDTELRCEKDECQTDGDCPTISTSISFDNSGTKGTCGPGDGHRVCRYPEH